MRAQSCAQTLQDHRVARDGQQDQQPEQRVAPEFADAEPEQALLQRADHDRAEHRAGNPSGAAEDIDAADDDGGDDVELQAARQPRR